ncbi:MAG: esterase family protein [Oscillospiraceae bacterium]|jgi:S-formylglutathione hydrolase FrmB|nr:esterase family protein [Oscillospiraceae bacterium]
MAFIRLRFFSEVLGRQTYVNVVMPQATTGEGRGWFAAKTYPPFPVLYLLHGMSDDQDSWLRNTSVERYAERRNMLVVMPTTDRGFYTDTPYGTNYFTYISEELPSVLRQYLPMSEKREDTYAAGLSMGGYGALKLALRNPARFSFAASLSGAVISEERMKSRRLEANFWHELDMIFGNPVKPEDDIYHLLETASPKPKLYVCCGTNDTLYEANDDLQRYAAKLGYDIAWNGDAGYGHTWDYWDMTIQTVLDMLPEQTKPR